MKNQDIKNMTESMNTARTNRTKGPQLPYKIKLRKDPAPLYTGAGTEYIMIGSMADDHQMEIIEERLGKDQKLWGRLKSGAGWIPLETTEKLITGE